MSDFGDGIDLRRLPQVLSEPAWNRVNCGIYNGVYVRGQNCLTPFYTLSLAI